MANRLTAMSDAELLRARREFSTRTAEDDDWFDVGGEIAAAQEEAVYEELAARGYTFGLEDDDGST